MRAAFLAAIFFALQHIALLVDSGAGAIVLLLLFFVVALGFRAAAGWTYNCTGSLFIVGLLHASGNAVTGGSGFGGDGLLPRLYEGQDLVGFLHLLASALVGVVVIIATRGRLGQKDQHSISGTRP
jgi:hypothetical protein